MNFCHLHLHSDKSILDGFGSAEAYCKRAKELGFEYLACTDHGNVDGLIQFQKECDKQNIKPVLGCEAYIVPKRDIKTKGEKRGHIVLLVENQTGWESLLQMLSIANLEGHYYRPRIDYETLLKYWSNGGLIAMTACASSFLNLPGGEDLLYQLQKEKPYNIFLEIMPHVLKEQKLFHERLKRITDIPMVATNDCHYINEDDAETQEVLLAIQTKAKWNDEKRFKFSIDGLYLRTDKEMIEAFKRQGDFSHSQVVMAMRNTIKIAKRCSEFRIPKKDISLPVPKINEIDSSLSPKKQFSTLVYSKWEQFKKINEFQIDEYQCRLKKEVDLIIEKKFAPYFLIVYELVSWCNSNKIMIGPGRGSAGGSLVAYILGITKVDPIKYNLLFERFIAKDRVDFPDIDLDFEDSKRVLIRKHIEEVYGKENVAGISTFGRMQARAVIRDVGRVFDIPYKDIDTFAKSINAAEYDKDVVLNSCNDTEEGKAFKRKYPKIINHCIKLEGQTRHVSQHPAAIIISSGNINKRAVLLNRNNSRTINWEMADCEYVGLIKLDVLGLNTLSIISETLQLIGDLDLLDSIPLNDEKVFKELSEGRTVGVFQMQSYLSQRMCEDVGIDSFKDIIDVLALARPGPLNSGMAKDYINIKHGRQKKERHHEIYEEITRSTQGIILFQEQIMQVISRVAGLDYTTSDKIRKVISKKKSSDNFAKYHVEFIKGCRKTRIFNDREANEFWEMLQSHAHYSFNRCVSGDTILKRSIVNHHKNNFSVREMYMIKNDIEYARRTGHLDLKVKFNFQKHYGYGLSLFNDKRIRKNIIKDIQPEGKRKVYRLTLENGAWIEITKNHKFLTQKGEQKLSDLTTDDSIYFCGDYEKTNKKYSLTSKKQITKGKKYGSHFGFPTGEKNPGYIDGSYIRYRNFKNETPNICKLCGQNKTRIEVHHVDGNRNNNDFTNLQKLCVSCHKKIHYNNGRTKQGQKGYPVSLIRVESIKKIGEIDTWNITMAPPYHNFVTDQNIVTCNSHAVEYATISYWTSYLKIHYPSEFLCASLTHGQEQNKQALIDEADRIGLEIKSPKYGVSDSFKWKAKDDYLYCPFVEIKGIGEKTARLCSGEIKVKKTGFFELQDSLPDFKGKIGKIMNQVEAFDKNSSLPEEAYGLFGFTFPEIREKILLPSIKRARFSNPELKNCSGCELRKQCRSPVFPSKGIYNAMIIGEAPGTKEDEKGISFIGKAGELLWDELSRFELSRKIFHVTNVCKCYPGSLETPNSQHILDCWKWLEEEIRILEPRIILALGNTTLKALTDRDGGIMDLSGKHGWIPKVKAHVFWCVHPAAVLRQRSERNKELFSDGIEAFSKQVLELI